MIEFLQNWEKKRSRPAAVFGAGKSGQGARNLLGKLDWECVTYDERDRAFGVSEARESSVVVTSPGFRKNHPWVELAHSMDIPVINELDLAARFHKSPVVAITGTNGKTSLTSLLTHLWNRNGRPAIALGNIGVSFSQAVADGSAKDKTVFLETSSFQAEGLSILRPKSVLWTNFDADHLDHHGDEKSYFKAKTKLLERSIGQNNLVGESVLRKAHEYGYKFKVNVEVVYREEISDEEILPSDHFLVSYPQSENRELARTFCLREGIQDEAICRAMVDYQPYPHRLQKVASIGEATFWNDSKSTNFGSVHSALKNFSSNLFWLGGGREKGGNPVDLVRGMVGKVSKAFVFGEVGPRLYELLIGSGIATTLCKSIPQAVQQAFAQVETPTDVLLSPGFSSFDEFSSYEQRGVQFAKYVLNLNKITIGERHHCLVEN